MGGHPGVQGLLIVDVSETGAVKKWNDQNPQHSIEVGQAVLEANGISDPRDAIFQIFRDTRTVELLLSRELGPGQRELLRASRELHRRRAIVADLLQDVPPADVPPADVPPAEEPWSCAICFEGGGEEAQLPCEHRFHRACAERWLTVGHLRCPLCNRRFG
eukprot:Skav216909  [mRNA]  locus=scaffold685:294093:294575:- [translate_table: standard]